VESRTTRFWQWWAALSLRRSGTIALIGLAILGLCVPAAARLYGDLRTDLRELLPQGAPAAVGLEELEKRIGGLSHLAIVVQTDDLKAGERFVDELARRLKTLPPSLVASVYWRVDAEKEFLDRHGALYADLKDLYAARDALRARIAAINPLLVDLAEEAEKPPAPINLDEVLGRIRSAYHRIDRFPDGYLAGEGGRTLVMLLSPAGAAVNLEDDQRIFDAVDGVVKSLDVKRFHPSIRVGYGGEVRSVIEAQEALVRDLMISSTLVLLAVSLALVLYYRTVRALPLLAIPLFAGVAVTFALSRAVIHYLNPNTAFLGSIIVGNGINAGIILLARYHEERRRGSPPEQALPVALDATWLATFAASAAAAASYGSLGAASFRGFNQFAFMGFFGMTLCWIATYAMMPALIALQEKWWPSRELSSHKLRVVGWFAGHFAQLVVKRPAWPAALTATLALGSVYAAMQFAKEPIQYDFRKLGSRSGFHQGAGYWDKHVDAVLQSYQTPTVVLTDSPGQAEAVAAALEKEKDQQGPDGTIESVVTLQQFLPKDQPRKLELLREIFSLLDKRPRSELLPEVRRLREHTKLEPVAMSDIPERLTRVFVEKDGHRGRLALVYPTLTTDAANGRAQIAHTRAVREAALRVDPTARIAGQIVLTTDIVAAITNDGALTALLSFMAVALLTLLVMRSLRDAAWVVGSLSLGVLWMFGAMTVLGLKLNFVNFAVLPITFGIGVDYAVNLYQRYRQAGSVEEALATSGGAVALCSLTTIIGYATLVTADNQAIQSFGLTAVLGEVTCLSAALFALPAVLSLRRRPGVIEDAAQQGA
jgi:predicted RND superfamily exporter protein